MPAATTGGANPADGYIRPTTRGGGILASFNDFIGELKRRRVIRALIAWGVFAFAVLQVFEPLMHAFHWQEGALTTCVVLLAVGFPVTVALAWVFDLRQGRIERTLAASGPPGAPRGPALVSLLVGVGLAAAVPGLAWYFLRQPAARVAPAAGFSLAVLPFENLTGEKESEVFSDGMTEELMNALAQLPGVHVAARTSSFTFKGKRAPLGEVGEKLRVTHVVEGSVRKAEGRVRVTARLEEVAGGTQLWAASYEEPLSDVFGLQASLARAIASALHLSRGADGPTGATASVRAYELYLKGRFHWAERPLNAEATLKAYEDAVAIDPGFAPAWAGLAAAYATLGSWENGTLPPGEAFPKAKAAAQRALAIDPAIAEAHAALGYVLAHYDRAFEASEREFETALRLRPDLPGSHHWYSHLLVAEGRGPESLRESLRTKELDPLDPVHNVHLAWHYFFTGDAESARRLSAELAKVDPRQFWYPWFVALAEHQQGRPAVAVEMLSLPVVKDKAFTFLASQKALSLAALGRLDEVRQIEAQLLERQRKGYVPAYDLALVRLALGDRPGALEQLRQAVDEHSAWAIYMAADPRLRPLAGDPAFKDLLGSAGLDRVKTAN